MKYKKLTPEQIKISLDRLTRFKFTREKYLRVFSDIILSNLIEPKIKKNELLNYPAEKIKKNSGRNFLIIHSKIRFPVITQ